MFANPLNQEFSPVSVRTPGWNYGSASIPTGSVVAFDQTSTQTDNNKKARMISGGVLLPNSTNYLLRGIARAFDGRSTASGAPCEVITGGLAKARVRVPAAIDLPVGTMLTAATAWDATNNLVVFGTTSAGANAGVLEPVVYGGVLAQPLNPIAYLAEALTANGSADTYVTAYVYVLPFHQPRVHIDRYVFPAANSTSKADIFLRPAMGPGILRRVFAQLLTGGSSGDLSINVTHAPFLGTADKQSLLSTAMNIANDAGDGAVAGLAVGPTGDNDTGNGLGTGGTIGVITASQAVRMFPTNALLALQLTYANTPANQADLSVCVVSEML